MSRETLIKYFSELPHVIVKHASSSFSAFGWGEVRSQFTQRPNSSVGLWPHTSASGVQGLSLHENIPSATENINVYLQNYSKHVNFEYARDQV